MSSTTKKHSQFVLGPMGDRPVTDLPGIGEVLVKKLKEKGFDKAYKLLGQFLLLNKDVDLFTGWLKDTAGANSNQAESCAQCLEEWCNSFL